MVGLMKIKSILQLKKRLDKIHEGESLEDDDTRPLVGRYDAYEECIILEETDDGRCIYLTVTEAKRLQSLLKKLL